MRDHPIPNVTEPMQYRAIGLVRGIYEPEDDEKFTRGKLIDSSGAQIDSVVLGRVITLMKRHLKVEEPHLWVVYPRCREIGHLHLQISGVWEPSTLSEKASQSEERNTLSNPTDTLPEGDDYFSIRGELIFTRPEKNELVIKIRQNKRPNGDRPLPFKLNLEGQIPPVGLRNFVDLKVRRIEQKLLVENYELLGAIQTRGGKNKRGGKKTIQVFKN